MKKPNFFIVGAPKCGTTALDNYLKQHPEIYIPDVKEIHFYGSDLNIGDKKDAICTTEDEYLKLFSDTNAKLRGESSVWYLYSKAAANEISEMCPNAKIIVMIRNPIDMLHSLHSQLLLLGDEITSNFDSAIDAELSILGSNHSANRIEKLDSLRYGEVAMYSEQIARYYYAFGKSNVHVIMFDEFVNNTLDVYRNTLVFLGVSNTNFKPEISIINTNKIVAFKFINQALDYIRLSNHYKVYKLIPTSLRSKIYSLVKLINTKRVNRKPMSRNSKYKIANWYSDEINRLELLIGVDLSGWKSDEY